jgi:hypothetical protein
MKKICIVDWPERIGYTAPDTRARQFKLPSGTLLDTIGTVTSGDTKFYVVPTYNKVVMYVPTKSASLVEEIG